MTEDIFVESSKVYEKWGKFKEDIKEYKKKYKEHVDYSTEIYSDLRFGFLDELLQRIFSFELGDNLLDTSLEIELLLKNTNKIINTLRFLP